MREETAKKGVRIVALIVFGLFSIVSALLLFDRSEKYLSVHMIRNFGVAVTIWASLRTAFDFAMHQAKAVKAWFIGANLVILSSVVLLCMLALRLEQVKDPAWETQAQISHLILIHAALALYLVWDMLAKAYYKTEYHEWYEAYSLLMSYDLIITLAFFCAYIPYLHVLEGSGFSLESQKGFIDGAIGFLLFTEFLAYYIFAPEVRSRAIGKGILSVREGYNRLAGVYDRGNAVMRVERRHTLQKLRELDLEGTVVDLGCGTGFYTLELAKRAKKVIAIDPSSGMLGVLREKLTEQENVQIIEGPAVSVLRRLPEGSVDGVLCCLVIDHLDGDNLQVALEDIHRILRPEGWLYITDVNAYYEKLKHPFAKFIDSSGMAQKIAVFPHTIKEVLRLIREAGFDMREFKVDEAVVSEEEIRDYDELEELENFPLILEYYVRRN